MLKGDGSLTTPPPAQSPPEANLLQEGSILREKQLAIQLHQTRIPFSDPPRAYKKNKKKQRATGTWPQASFNLQRQ